MSEKTGRKRTRRLTAAILFGSIVSLLEAAIPTGTVVGTVRDESGAIIPGAKVTITHQGTGAVRSMQTDSSGNYNFPLLPVGTYTLKIEMQGFQTFVQKEFLLQVDQNLTIRIRERQPGGLLVGIFVDDRRDPKERVSIIADHGTVLKNDGGSFLVLEDGNLQRFETGKRDPALVAFGRYAFDMSKFPRAMFPIFIRGNSASVSWFG